MSDKRKLELKDLACYLPYGLRAKFGEKNLKINTGQGSSTHWIGISALIKWHNCNLGEKPFPLLRPLSSLTKEINYGIQTYKFTDLWEIGDTDGCNFEFDHGNIKLIKSIEEISKHECYNDIMYLPHHVVQSMIEHHYDIFGLLPSGLAIPIEA